MEFESIITTPADYNPVEKLPMVVFLHGMGERGTNLNIVKTHGIPKYFSKNPDYLDLRVITLSPQCPDTMVWNDCIQPLFQYIKVIADKYNVDNDNISLTGISMGGFGTWEMAIKHKEYFSKIAPICGGGDSFCANILHDIPIWAFHGDKDEVVPISHSQIMIDAIRKVGGSPEFTILNGIEHNSWDFAYERTNLIKWLCNK